MNDEEKDFIERKKNLILRIVRNLFEESCMTYLNESDWHTVADIDRWFDAKLTEYDQLVASIRKYYNDQIYK